MNKTQNSNNADKTVKVKYPVQSETEIIIDLKDQVKVPMLIQKQSDIIDTRNENEGHKQEKEQGNMAKVVEIQDEMEARETEAASHHCRSTR